MRRADRLYRIIETLRGRRRAITAEQIARAMEVSVRTIYRDIADLAASGVPIDGEAGVGYVLRPGFHLPPVNLDAEEVEALALGVAMAVRWGDAGLAAAAERLRNKLKAVMPPNLAESFDQIALYAPAYEGALKVPDGLGPLRRAMRERRKVRLAYRDVDGEATSRVVRPLGLSFFAPFWTLAAWCELRQDFRMFRVDRIDELAMTDARFSEEPGKRMIDYVRLDRARGAARRADPRRTAAE
ncbi:MAG: YafY family protein [Alphaproteobacteria bacterium]